MTADDKQFDAAVIGAGPAGLIAAAGLAEAGLRTAVVDATAGAPSDDARTTALMQGSVRMLRNLDLWGRLEPASAPLRVMKLVDDTSHRFKAPTVAFDSAELGDEPFGWNIPNVALVEAARERVRAAPRVDVFADRASNIEPHEAAVRVQLVRGDVITARVLLAADGRNSLCRSAVGIDATRWGYPQSAIATSFAHEREHDGISTEFHRDPGPLTLVPLPGRRSSVVWVERPAEAARLLGLGDAAFAAELTRASHGELGRVTMPEPRGSFPLSGLTARRFAARRVLLIGEAAHVLPPIGAQGLNLGFRDAALACELVADAHHAGEDVGGDAVTEAYDRRRRRDVVPRTVAVDLLNRSLFQGFLPFQGARGAGLALLQRFAPLRREVMRRGIGPDTDLPRLMRPA